MQFIIDQDYIVLFVLFILVFVAEHSFVRNNDEFE